jgi:hypothetical protein
MARNAFYGDPGKGQIAAQMVPVVPPFAMYYEGKRVRRSSFTEGGAGAARRAAGDLRLLPARPGAGRCRWRLE